MAAYGTTDNLVSGTITLPRPSTVNSSSSLPKHFLMGSSLDG